MTIRDAFKAEETTVHSRMIQLQSLALQANKSAKVLGHILSSSVKIYKNFVKHTLRHAQTMH